MKAKKFGRWTVLQEISITLWRVQCSCGSVREVYPYSLLSGKSKSCGCLRSELATINAKHGHASNHAGKKVTTTYKAWAMMHDRCRTDPDYVGVTVCSRWSDFRNFLEDMGERPEGLTLDRLSNKKGYFKSNCRWATQKEQANNKTNNVLIKFNGQTKTLAQWAEELEINYRSLYNRLYIGWPVQKAFTTPIRRKSP